MTAYYQFESDSQSILSRPGGQHSKCPRSAPKHEAPKGEQKSWEAVPLPNSGYL
jgi:hypothetical protein